MDKWTYPFCKTWDPNDPVEWAEGQALDFPDVIAEGPFLVVVNDEYAWAGQRVGHLTQVAQKRADPINLRQWRYLADLYSQSMGISRQSFVLRFSSMRRRLLHGDWVSWRDAHPWPDGGDHMWSAIVHGNDPWLQAREHEGRRQVRVAR